MGKVIEEVNQENVGTVEEVLPEDQVEVVVKKKKARVLRKDLEAVPGSLVMGIIGIEGTKIYDPKALPENVQTELPAFALSHKLGDAASGKSGQEAADAIDKVWEGLMKGDWKTKAPASKKIAVSDIAKSLEGMPEEEAAKAREALAKLGITL